MKNMVPYVATWSIFAVVVLVLAAYRKMLAGREDDSIHVTDGAAGLIPQQVANNRKIEVVEKWGKTLTAVVVVAGLVLAAFYIYGIFQSGTTTAVVQ